MHSLRSTLLAAAVAAGTCTTAQAQIVNGGFEAGLAGWSTFGDASTQGSAPEGSAQLVLSNAGLDPDEFDAQGQLIGPFNLSGRSSLEVGVPGGLEQSSGFALGAFDPAGEFAIEGSLAQQSFSASAGQTLSFIWNFGTRDTFSDYAFVAIDGLVIRLAGVADATLPGSGDDLQQTGLKTFSHTFANGVSHTLAFGVVDVGDSAVRSTLAIDQVQLSAVPEPQTFALLAAGLVLLVLARARRR